MPGSAADLGAAARAAVDRVEALIQEEVGRGITGLFAAARGGLWGAAAALGAAPRPSVAIITGFYVPAGTPPAAETDGPVGAALLAAGLRRLGMACRVTTDAPCRAACAAALAAAGVADMPLDVIEPGAALDEVAAAWGRGAVTPAIA